MTLRVTASIDNQVDISVGAVSGPFFERTTIGAQVAHGMIPAGSVAGTSIVWETDAAGYAAENGLPGDRDPNLLRVPKNWPDAVSGLVVVATQDGARYGRKRFTEGDYLTRSVMQLNASGESLNLAYKRNPSGGDGAGDSVECVVGMDITAAVSIRVFEQSPSPAVGITQAQHDALNAHFSRLDAEILALQQGEHSGTAPPVATTDDVDNPTGNTIRSFTTALLARLVRGIVNRPFLARIMGGLLRDVTQNDDTLTIHAYDSTGALHTINVALTAPGAGGGGITLAQAAALFQNPPFVVDMGPPIRVTYTRPLPDDGSITMAMLAEAVQDAINGKANLSAIRPEARADFPRLTGPQQAAARGRIGAESTSAVAALTALVARKIEAGRLRPEADATIDPLSDEQMESARDRIGAGTQMLATMIAAFAIDGRLTNASVQHFQSILNAFTGGVWRDAAGAGDDGASFPFVGEELSQVQFTPQTIVGLTYGQSFGGGPHYEAAYIPGRVPEVYEWPLRTMRFAIGRVDDATDDPQTYLLTDDLVTLITTIGGYHYYSCGPVDKPAGERWAFQIAPPFELDDALVLGGLPDGGSDDDILFRDGPHKGRWATLPHLATPPRLLRGRSETLVVGRGAQYDVAFAAAIFTTFDLDDNPNAELHLSVIADITNVSAGSPNLGWVEGKANQDENDRHLEFSIVAFASELAAADEFDALAADTSGLHVVNRTAWNGPTDAGSLNIWVVRNAMNQVGVWAKWEGEAGAETFSIPLIFDMSATITDSAAGRSFLLFNRPAAAVPLRSIVPSDAGGQSVWATLATLPAITAAQAGRVMLGGDMGVEVVTASSGGGDRVDTELCIARTRGADKERLIVEEIYGPRNLVAAAGSTSVAYAAASRKGSGSILHRDTAQEGDIYTLEARIIIQRTRGTAIDVSFPVSRNELLSFPT